MRWNKEVFITIIFLSRVQLTHHRNAVAIALPSAIYKDVLWF